MRRHYAFCLALWICGLAMVRAATLQLNNGSTIDGEPIVPATSDGLNIKTGDSTYQHVLWTDLTQSALQELAKNPKLTPFVEPYLEVPEDARIKKTEVPITPPRRLDRPAEESLVRALLNSSVGLAVLLLIYAANIYAGYEIAVFRSHPVALVSAAAALAPVIGPIIFLAIPRRVKKPVTEEVEQEVVESVPAAEMSEPSSDSPKAPPGVALARPQAAAAPAPPAQPQVFQRGQSTFNRRFFETKFPGFFGIVRRDAEKDSVLVIKTSRGEFVATRITRIAANDVHVEIQKGAASQEVMVPFVEIREIQLKHPGA